MFPRACGNDARIEMRLSPHASRGVPEAVFSFDPAVAAMHYEFPADWVFYLKIALEHRAVDERHRRRRRAVTIIQTASAQ